MGLTININTNCQARIVPAAEFASQSKGRQVNNLSGYFNLALTTQPRHEILVAPLFQRTQISADHIWAMRELLSDYFIQKGIDPDNRYSTCKGIAESACIIVNGEEFGREGFLKTRLQETQKVFDQRVASYMQGEVYDAAANICGNPGYSHTKLFGWIYSREISAMRSLGLTGEFHVLELAAAFGNSIFSKLKYFPGGKFIGADIDPALIGFARAYVTETNIGNVAFIEGDATNSQSPIFYRSYDILTASHLLEHLDPQNPPETYIARWLSAATKAAIISLDVDSHITEEAYHLSDHRLPLQTEANLVQLSNKVCVKNAGWQTDLSECKNGIMVFLRRT